MRKHRCKRILAVFLAILILCSLMVFSASGSTLVYLMAVNDKVIPLTVDNMPMYSGGQLYIPYVMLSTQSININLGVRAQYSSSASFLTITNGSKTAFFDIKNGIASDQTGARLNVQALVRNSMAYIPIDWLCRHFPELGYSLTRTSYGILVRLNNGAAVLSDADFIDAGDTLLRQNAQNYLNAIAPPVVTPVPPPAVDPTPTPTPTPTTPVTPTPPPTVAPTPIPLIYLAFLWGDQASEVADYLSDDGQRALFFFTVDQLALQDDLIRRLVGSGHQIGLVLTGTDPTVCLEQLETGRQLLKDIARSPLFIVSADELNPSDLQTIRDAGCAVWNATLSGDDFTTQSAILNRLSSDNANYVELTCRIENLALIRSLLRTFSGDRYHLCQVLPSVL